MTQPVSEVTIPAAAGDLSRSNSTTPAILPPLPTTQPIPVGSGVTNEIKNAAKGVAITIETTLGTGPSIEAISNAPQNLIEAGSGLIKAAKQGDGASAVMSGIQAGGALVTTASAITLGPVGVAGGTLLNGAKNAIKDNKPIHNTAESAKRAYHKSIEKHGDDFGGQAIATTHAVADGGLAAVRYTGETVIGTGVNTLKSAVGVPNKVFAFLKKHSNNKEETVLAKKDSPEKPKE